MQRFPRGLPVACLVLAIGCVPSHSGSVPLLPPLPPANAAPPSPNSRVQAWKTESPADPKEYPEGTRRVEAGMRLGDLALNHNEFHVPAGKDVRPRWDFAKIALPDGSTLIGDSLNWQAGNRGYSPWSFLGVLGKLPGAAKAGELLKPSLCIAAASAEGNGFAVAEMVFQRPIDADRSMTFAVRLKRLAGDPSVYLLLDAEPAGGTVERVSLHGYPNTTHPIFYDLHYEWPRNASFMLRERWVWAAGQDWNLHDAKQPHKTPVGAEAAAGVFFYNRHNSETGGMLAVFLPEEVADVDAAGTYGVNVTFGLKRPAIRLALRTWYDMRDWEPVRERFLAELPERVKRLREMSFGWPVSDPLGKDLASAEFLLARSPAGGELEALRRACDECRTAAAAVKAMAPPDSPAHHKAERAALLAAERVRAVMVPVVKQWAARGGEFAPER